MSKQEVGIVERAIERAGGTARVARDFSHSYNAIRKWEIANRVPPRQVPEFIERYGDAFAPYELNPESHPRWLFDAAGSADRIHDGGAGCNDSVAAVSTS